VAYLTALPLDLTALLSEVQSPARGAVASFVGIVRNHHQGRDVLLLHYSAYAPMAEAECARIVAEAQEQWNVTVALRHRIGRLQIGEAAVAIAVASAHRDAAFAGCRYVIEEVKRRVPIWKKEYFADGTVQWVGSGGGHQLDGGAAGPGGSDLGSILSSPKTVPHS
jgi:molybdopterin synthase catalytic subunit